MSKEPNTALRRLALFAFAVVSLGALPVFAKMFGFQFLPSLEWWEESAWPAWGSGIVVGATMGVLFCRACLRDEPDHFSLKSLSMVLIAPLFFGWIGSQSVSAGFPMIYTALFGEQGEHQYNVVKASGYSDRKCRNKIELRGNPFILNELCGFSKEFLVTLRPGIDIAVYGRSSYFGVFVSSARIAD